LGLVIGSLLLFVIYFQTNTTLLGYTYYSKQKAIFEIQFQSMSTSVFDLLRQMDGQNIIVAYNGAIDDKLLESVYEMMDTHLEERKMPGDKRKKFFHVLIEALQNVFHHQPENGSAGNDMQAGFVIKHEDDKYTIITGNLLLNSAIERLEEKLQKVNNLSAAELRSHYQESLANTELSKKGGAGLGIIEMARKSGTKLKYEFTNVNNEYSFFTLEVTI
jgi:hypothetical protein